VLDRTKEPGCTGEPLYLDVLSTFAEARAENRMPLNAEPVIVGGRYGLSSKEFNAPMVKAVFDNLAAAEPKNHFTVGIVDDVSHTSLHVDDDFDIAGDDVFRGLFFGLGSDGTVGANKNSIKIIGEETDNFAQGYFVYDSKKAGAVTISHLRFGQKPIRSSYLIKKANFVACHQWVFLEKYDMLGYAQPGATFLINSPYGPDEGLGPPAQGSPAGHHRETAQGLLHRRHPGGPRHRDGPADQHHHADLLLRHLRRPAARRGHRPDQEGHREDLRHEGRRDRPAQLPRGGFNSGQPPRADDSGGRDRHHRAAAHRLRRGAGPGQEGDRTDDRQQGRPAPGAAFPPTAPGPPPPPSGRSATSPSTSRCGTRTSASSATSARWSAPTPPSAPRSTSPTSSGAPETFKSVDYKAKDFDGKKYTIQVAPEDCTGCTLCVRVCPAKDKSNPKHKALNMVPQMPLREPEAANYEFFLDLPEVDRTAVKADVKGSQFLQPLFEYSGACAGCGETPYVKLLTQLFGDRTLIGNATGCSSIYGGNLPTTPYAKDANGRGPAWSNSLFEDNAEFGFGFRLAVDQQRLYATQLVKELAEPIGSELVDGLIDAVQEDEAGIAAQRERVEALRSKLAGIDDPRAKILDGIADYLVKKSVWAVGGDGWAYDIGYGGLDHVLATGRNVNLLVLDTGCTPTPAARPPRPPRWRRRPSSP
jgi:pyruvate-ferredoxin/flavodoxin oxidoreductase